MPRDAGKMMTGATVTVIATATTVDAPAARM